MMGRSRRFRQGESRLGWRLALWFMFPRLGRPSTLEPACWDRNVPHAWDFRDGFQVVDRLLTPVGS